MQRGEMMKLIDVDALLKDIEDLKRSPWYLADYISDQRRLGMKEGLDMVSSCSRHAPTIEAIPVEFIEAEIDRMRLETQIAMSEGDDERAERAMDYQTDGSRNCDCKVESREERRMIAEERIVTMIDNHIAEYYPQRKLIRCKDCKYRDPEDKKCDCGHDIRWQLPRHDDWYCADAERKEE